MKLPENHVVDLIKEIADQTAVHLVLLIKDKENVSEFKIAEKLEISVNQVRRILYILSEHTLVSFTRKKDKKKGWYIYYWTFNSVKALSVIMERKQLKVESLKAQIKQEQQENFFVCKNGCIRVNETGGLEHEFRCPECGEVLQQEGNKLGKIEDMEKQILSLKEELKELRKLKAELRRMLEEKMEREKKRLAAKRKAARPKRAVKKKKKVPKKKKLKKRPMKKKKRRPIRKKKQRIVRRTKKRKPARKPARKQQRKLQRRVTRPSKKRPGFLRRFRRKIRRR